MTLGVKIRTSLTDPGIYRGMQTYSRDILISSGSTTKTPVGGTDKIIDPNSIFPRAVRKHFKDQGGSVTIQHATCRPDTQSIVAWDTPPGNGAIIRQGSDQTMIWFADKPFFVTPVAASPLISDSVLSAIGAKAWASKKPTAQRGGLGQALGELHDLPTLPKLLAYKQALGLANRRTTWKRLAKDTSSNYLNYQFGWVPLLSDIRDLFKNAMAMRKNIEQLRRDNGRPVRRSGKVGQTASSSTSVTTTGNWGSSAPGFLVPNLTLGCYKGPWTKTVTTKSVIDYHFSARFRYYIDFVKGSQGDLDTAHRVAKIVLGAELSPYTLYQLLPWSWLIDWFTSLGSVVNNLVNDAGDNLVADYAYINGKETVSVETVLSTGFNNSSTANGGDYTFTHYYGYSNFRRIAASPFGFGLTLANLSPKQVAILAALGINRYL